MFSQSADQPAADESPAPVGMRELPPQPAKPVMPAYGTATPVPVEQPAGPGPDDSVIAVDDHIEGTFTSRGTVVVKGSVKGRIEAVQVRIEDGARVEADVIVDEAIIAGEFNGNLTCRQRLEAHASGRINGHVETHKLMLHEGASVEGEMHMLTEAPKDASATIRGTASPRGGEPAAKGETPDEPAASIGRAATTKPAPAVTPSSTAKPTAPAPPPAVTPEVSAPSGASVPAGSDDAASAARQSVAETLRAETLRVAPRTTTSVASYSGGPTNGGTSQRPRNGATPTSF